MFANKEGFWKGLSKAQQQMKPQQRRSEAFARLDAEKARCVATAKEW